MIHSLSADKIKDDHTKKTFRYSKIHETFNLNDMYESLNPKVIELVKENRAKFTSMNFAKSKDLINKTHSKLIAFLRSQPVRKTYSNSTSKTERPNNKVFNIYRRQDEEKENRSQQIFDFTKLEQIMQTYEQSSRIKPRESLRFSGALTEKVFKLSQNKKREISTARPFTQRTQSKANLELSSTIGDYMGWKTEKLKRRMKKPFY